MVCILSVFVSVFLALIVTGDTGLTQNHDRNVMNVADFAMDFHNHRSNYPYAFKVVEIISDGAQLFPPARVKYTIQIRATQTECKNQGKVRLTDCAVRSNAETMTCTFIVLAVPGNDYVPKRVLSDQCV